MAVTTERGSSGSVDGGRQGGAAPRSSCVLGERAKTGKEGLTLQHNSRSVVNKSPDTEKANARAKAPYFGSRGK